MKQIASIVSAVVLLALASGCATSSQQSTPVNAIRSVPVPHPVANAAIVQAAEDVAQSLNLPAPTSVDADSGVVSFANTANGTLVQVFVLSSSSVQITVVNPAAAGQGPTDQTADTFASQLATKLKNI